jgi:molecular chaperone DnaK (HSP70)
VLVSFLGNERFMGEAAVSQLRTNMGNTITQVKRLLGRKFSDESVQEDLKTHLNYKIVQLPGDEIGVEVRGDWLPPRGFHVNVHTETDSVFRAGVLL